MSLFELRQVVLESCAGLAALHGAGLVHRDIKPANLWLRLPLAGGERFDPDEAPRSRRARQPLATVVIDFGMVRAIRVPPDVGGRFVAGTAGLHRARAGARSRSSSIRARTSTRSPATIYNVTTGRAFFDEIENPRDRIIAHMRRDPFEDAERLRGVSRPPSRSSCARRRRGSPADRPSPLEFGREFAAAL